jgi:hypothetical protein
MRRLVSVVVVALCALAVTASAQAEGKQRVVDRFGGQYGFAAPCGDFGPYAFDVLVSGTERGQFTEILAADGSLLQQVLNIQFFETNTNSDTGESITLRGAVHVVWDFASNTRTLSGKVYLATRPGDGIAIQDTGRITITLDTSEALFVAGPHGVFFGGGLDAVVCEELAAA